MHVDYTPDFPVTDDSCRAATGRTFAEWGAYIEAAGMAEKRRDAIQAVYNETGRGKDVWWPTTIWVEFERARGVVEGAAQIGRLGERGQRCGQARDEPSSRPGRSR